MLTATPRLLQRHPTEASLARGRRTPGRNRPSAEPRNAHNRPWSRRVQSPSWGAPRVRGLVGYDVSFTRMRSPVRIWSDPLTRYASFVERPRLGSALRADPDRKHPHKLGCFLRWPDPLASLRQSLPRTHCVCLPTGALDPGLLDQFAPQAGPPDRYRLGSRTCSFSHELSQNPNLHAATMPFVADTAFPDAWACSASSAASRTPRTRCAT